VGDPEWSEDERSEASRNGGAPTERAAAAPSKGKAPDPEVDAKATRRKFTAEYKLRIVREADACTEPGQVGALLRREGLYSSHLQKWRALMSAGAVDAMAAKKRGPKPTRDAGDMRRLAELERENKRLQRKLTKAEAIIDFQKKVHELLGIPLKSPDDEGSD
jgi:transposase-like protein